MREKMMPESEKPKFPEVDEMLARDVEGGPETSHIGTEGAPFVHQRTLKTKNIKPREPQPARIIIDPLERDGEKEA